MTTYKRDFGVGGFPWYPSQFPKITRSRSRIFSSDSESGNKQDDFLWSVKVLNVLALTHLTSNNNEMLISKIILARFFAIFDTWQPNFIHIMLWSRRVLEA